MKDKKDFIENILTDIYKLSIPKIDNSRRMQIFDIIDIVINGDNVAEYVVSDVSVREHLEVFVYILTNNRLIIVNIDTQDKINTYPFLISEMEKLLFKSPEPDMISVEIHLFHDKLLGLKYPKSKKKITDFFQVLDKLLTKRS